ncbi:MAG: DUF2087 domain-containing protein [Victivallaceae bacterium]|nr:DUF2087 domain-containing protein [Victivallaceae bacterium]
MLSAVYHVFFFPNVEFLRKLAKDRKKLLLENDPETVAWYRKGYDGGTEVSLQKIQHLTAVERGFKSWAELLRHTIPLTCPPELRGFVGADGRLKAWPGKMSRQIAFLRIITERIKPGIVYTESQFNTILNCYHCFNDPARLRRDMLDLGLITRNPDGSNYRRL